MEKTPGWGLKIEYMKDDYLKKIEQYFQKEMDEQQLADFQQALASDKELNAAFEARQEMEEFLTHRPNREALKANIAAIEGDFFHEATAPTTEAKRIVMGRKKLYWLIGAAAAALILVFAIPTLFNTTPSYQQFAEHRPLSLQERSTSDNAIAQIEAAFNSQNYQTAYSGLDTYLQENPQDVSARVYKGISALELNLFTEATNIFSTLSEGNSAFKQTARWYLGLTYLKQEDYSSCKAALLLIPEDNYWYPKARSILTKLPK